MKTKEERAQYCREWRIKNREKYLATKKEKYHKNIGGCKEATKERARRYYETFGRARFLERYHSDTEFKEKQRKNSLNRLQRRREILYFLRLKMGGACVDCEYDEEPNILQFHHHNKDKTENVTNLQTLEKMEREAEKCILLCPNCHAIRHLRNHA